MAKTNVQKAAAAKAAKAAAAKAAADKDKAGEGASEGTTVPALSITSSRPGFRRAGHVFGKEPTVIALSDLSDEQIDQLENEPVLTVAETEIDAAVE